MITTVSLGANGVSAWQQIEGDVRAVRIGSQRLGDTSGYVRNRHLGIGDITAGLVRDHAQDAARAALRISGTAGQSKDEKHCQH